jgi:peroxiredoxin
MPNLSATSFETTRSAILREFRPEHWAAYSHLVDWLRTTDVASQALSVGDVAPDFLLPDADGRLVSSEQLRREGPLVVSFFRGGWCPFCIAELCALQAERSAFDRLKAKLVVLSPDTGGFPRQLRKDYSLDLTILSDVDYGVAMSYGVLFSVPAETKAFYAGLGLDFASRHGSSVWMLPLPATYVIDRDGRIVSSFVEPDFTIRQEPGEILQALHTAATVP